MKSAVKKKSAYATKDGFAYLTKRTVITKAKTAGKLAARKAMVMMGFVITAKSGWIIKKYPDGRVEKISKIQD
jgi:hypothetical protein